MTCEKCGRVHSPTVGSRPCLGHISGISHPERKGEPCTRQALVGMDVCHAHGPNKAARAKARRVAEEQKTIAKARKLIPDVADRDTIGDPVEKLIAIAEEAAAFMESLRILANGLNDKIRYKASGAGTEQLRAELSLYQGTMKDLSGILVSLARLDLDKRLAQSQVARDQAYFKVLVAILAERGIDVTEPEVAAQVERHLHAV